MSENDRPYENRIGRMEFDNVLGIGSGDLALRAKKIDTIIISGGSTDVGVASTVFAGRDMDYNMIVARDACATNHDQRAHDVLMDLIFPRMARVRTTHQVLRMI